MHAISTVLSQHAEQASFLWGLRARAVAEPHYSLSDLAKLDQRVEANLDGLRVAGSEGWQLCDNELAWEGGGEVFAAAVLALESGDRSRVDLVLSQVTKSPELARGFISALGWLDYRQAEPYVKTLCVSESSALRRIGIAAAAIHRRDPGRALNQALADPDPLLRSRALRAAGELGRVELAPMIQRDLNNQETACRFWAAWSSALLIGHGTAIQVLHSLTESPGPYQEKALQIALRRTDTASSHVRQRWLAQGGGENDPAASRVPVVGAGVIGDPAVLPWLLEQMEIPMLARVAGEAFTIITGLDIALERLGGDQPEGFEPGPNDDPDDDNVAMDPDENLPWPDPDRVAAWWQGHSASFAPGTRYLLGRPISQEWLTDVLRHGKQRHRAGAALELAIMQPGQPLFEVRAPGFRQLAILQTPP